MNIKEIMELISKLPDLVSDTVLQYFDRILFYREQFTEHTPEFLRVFIGNVIGKNIVKVLKDAGLDGNFARGKVAEVIQWAFDLPDFNPDWATKPTD